MGKPVVTDEDGTRWITLDRPEILNALSVGDLAVITEAVTGIGPDISAIVLTGTGDRAFSAGMHVNTFADATPDSGRAIISSVRDCVGAIRLAPVPTVAMINGYCLGAAFEMALACDLRVAHPEVRFGLPEVKLGIPSVVDAALLHHYVGLSKAKEIILTAGLYSVTDLATYGLANRIVPPAQLREAVLDLLAPITACTSEVIAAQKELFETWLNHGLQHGIDTSVDVFADLFNTPATLTAIAQYQMTRSRR
ncbi:enoyl-CoA hydratase/isomerase family protein [Streptomyces sp. NPDC058232]|uniref:enoyl-CoA hydratase/isomerase family protein n=1 Tax=Streptomyces sp. NPDC058232 TaxID=3346393 RepID=UPI0036F0B8C3